MFIHSPSLCQCEFAHLSDSSLHQFATLEFYDREEHKVGKYSERIYDFQFLIKIDTSKKNCTIPLNKIQCKQLPLEINLSVNNLISVEKLLFCSDL